MGYMQDLVAHWDMSDINPVDIGWIGQGADMTGIGLVTATDVVNGIAGGKAIKFNGSNEYLLRAEADWRSEDGQGTICAWVRVNTLDRYNTIWSSADIVSTTRYLSLRIDNGNLLEVTQNNADTADEVYGDTVFVAGRWYHIAVTSDGSSYALYVNGVAQSLGIASGGNFGHWLDASTSRDNVTIGVYKGLGFFGYFDGTIDEVCYFSQPLTNIQVKDLINRTRQGRF